MADGQFTNEQFAYESSADIQPEPVQPAIKSVPVGAVFPSENVTVWANVPEGDVYGGAHNYSIQKCLGFKDGATQYQEPQDEQGNPFPNMANIQFVQKNDDGTIIAGLQSEQVILMLIDRHHKLNERFPSPQTVAILQGLHMALQAMEERVRERMERGVMGDLKK